MRAQTVSKRGALWICGLAIVGSTGIAIAQSGVQTDVRKAPVVPEMKAFKVVSEQGGESLAAASTVKPGEVIEYQVKYANRGAKAVKKLQATLPIPANLEFVSGTAKPAGAEASVDGKNFAAMPLKQQVKAADGSTKTVLVPTSEYRFLRWSVDGIEPGKSAQVSARARLAAVGTVQR